MYVTMFFVTNLVNKHSEDGHNVALIVLIVNGFYRGSI